MANLERSNRSLTPRQQEILEFMAQGMTEKQIATHLGIGYRTVKHHKHGADGIFSRQNAPKDTSGAVFQGVIDKKVDLNLVAETYDLTKIFTLTPRELEVLDVFTWQDADDRSNEAISISLSITVRGVKAHMTNIMDKLGVPNRVIAGLVFIAAAENLEQLEDFYAQESTNNDLYAESVDVAEGVQLTLTQIKILNAFANGKSYKEIVHQITGNILYMLTSPNGIYRVLHAPNELCAVLKAYQLGIIDVSENGIEPSNYFKLTRAELTVLEALTLNYGDKSTNKELARTLSITQNTVRNHFKSIFKKLEVQTRTQAGLGYIMWRDAQRISSKEFIPTPLSQVVLS